LGIADALLERAAIRHHHRCQQDRRECNHRDFYDRHVYLDLIVDEAFTHLSRNSTATSGLPSTHASRSRGSPEERKDSWSNLPAETTLAEWAAYAHRRHAIEQCHEEAKGELGWDQDQGRLWPGVHRHAVTVMLAYRLLVWLERRQQRRPKRQVAHAPQFPPRLDRPTADAPRRAP
jgi:SRSO17 transposase